MTKGGKGQILRQESAVYWKKGGRGVQKMAIWGDFQGLTGMTRGGKGGGLKIWKIGVTSFMDDPLGTIHK